jgi:hypothetical protein
MGRRRKIYAKVEVWFESCTAGLIHSFGAFIVSATVGLLHRKLWLHEVGVYSANGCDSCRGRDAVDRHFSAQVVSHGLVFRAGLWVRHPGYQFGCPFEEVL